MKEFMLHPRLEADTFFVSDLPLCRLLLINDSQYPWYILVPRIPALTEAHHLDDSNRQQLTIESDTVSRTMETEFSPDKMNVATIGNVVPQLHIHHIARYRKDATWPAPVWGARPAIPYSTDEREQMIERLKGADLQV